jgi:copper transport protein
MSRRGRIVAAMVVACSALALPAGAWAHAALLGTSPSASGVLNVPPAAIKLTYSEAVEPRFAIVSVTDAAGRQQTAGPPLRSATNPAELDVPLHRLVQGWYLVYWRVISADGHPVRGAFTFAVGPNPGPAPQFVIPSISETAATPRLEIARWVMFLSLMTALGLFVFRLLIARPLVAGAGASLRAVSIAFLVALGVALVATPVYVLMATSQFALRSFWSFGDLIPLMRVSSFGRSFIDLELVLALFALGAVIALWVDRPEREQRSAAELLATMGALAAAAATLVVPGLGGHAAQTSPRGLSLGVDWLHLAAGSIWLGGLVGLLVLWISLEASKRVAGLAICVPRFSTVAFFSVMVLIGSGIWASIDHIPTLASLWQTSYGKAIVAKVALLACALLLASVNLARTKPRLEASGRAPGLGASAAVQLRRLVTGEVVLVAAAVFAAAVLTSLAPPAKALGSIGHASAHVGPGPVRTVVTRNGYRLEFGVDPNRAAVPNTFAVRITRAGRPVRSADVTATFTMLDMEMGQQAYHLQHTGGGNYRRAAPALVMVGHWGLSFDVRPPDGQPFSVLLLDKARG